MGPDREEGHAIVRSEGRAVSAARACANPSGSRRGGSAASRAMEESNLRLRFWRPSGCRCPDGAFIVSALRFSTMPCRPCPRRHGMVCVPERLRSAGLSDRFGPFRRTGLRNRPESRRLMTRCHPSFHRSPSIQWDWPDSGSNRLSSIRLFATRRMVVAGGLEPPVFLCRRFTVCCRRRWATPPVHRFCPSRCDAYRARSIRTRKLMGDGSGSWSCRESNPGLAYRQPLLAFTCVSDA